jgi:8-oxo-dGTP diphosphatase
MVTVDVLIFRYQKPDIEIILIQRKNPPFKNLWAIPGGFIEMDETLKNAAIRELYEETSLQEIPLFPLAYADQPGRDPRGRTISFVFGGILSPPFPKPEAKDDATALDWFNAEKLPELAFDHRYLIKNCYEIFKNLLASSFGLMAFLESSFSRIDFENCCKALFNSSKLANVLIEKGLRENILMPKNQEQLTRTISISELYRKVLYPVVP